MKIKSPGADQYYILVEGVGNKKTRRYIYGERRICSKCGKSSVTEEFRIINNKTGQRAATCNSCYYLSKDSDERLSPLLQGLQYKHKLNLKKIDSDELKKNRSTAYKHII